ncbi:hypothetical protein [Desulfopila sp. IMCC35008]|uniref:hypothetical protein n=1 Tax=Desulfopila sp. IMCC35008 TaxID=2653858 RepID=UPI0013D34CA3|nr:hypothetical protein [Desulfopila sp. IMCC35008]
MENKDIVIEMDDVISRRQSKVKFRKEERLALHNRLERYSDDENKRVLEESSTDCGVSMAGAILLMKKRQRISDSVDEVDLFSELIEVSLIARTLQKEDAQIYLQDVISEYTKSENGKKFSDVVLELDVASEKRIWEGKVGKAVISGLFMKMRSKLKSAKKDEDKFKALADMIALSAMFNYDTVQDVFKKIRKEERNS